jgi:uncharacterized protein (UPF0276 family)
VVVHGLGLSIGSAHGWSEAYLELLDRVHARCPFVWHSEHLGFMVVRTETGEELHAGTALPMPFTEEALALLAPRAAALTRRYGVPFLLENLTYYLSDLRSEEGRDEIVVQVHLAGGNTRDGFQMDVHCDVVPEPVWELLAWLVPRAPNLAGVSFEMMEEAELSTEVIRDQLGRARQIWERTHPRSEQRGGRGAA